MARRRVPRTSPIGWREWVALPGLGVPAIKAKVDTGARTSSLHAFHLSLERTDGREIAHFEVHPLQRSAEKARWVEAEVIDHRRVRSSNGVVQLRPVIRTSIQMKGQRWPIEITLTSRDEMGFRMLLGRAAIRDRFVVDPSRSFIEDDR